MQNLAVAPQVRVKAKVFTMTCKIYPGRRIETTLPPSPPRLAPLLCYFWETLCTAGPWHLLVPLPGMFFLQRSTGLPLNSYKYLFKRHPLLEASPSSPFTLAASLSAFPIHIYHHLMDCIFITLHYLLLPVSSHAPGGQGVCQFCLPSYPQHPVGLNKSCLWFPGKQMRW